MRRDASSPRPDYDFQPFFDALAGRNWYEDDRLLRALLRRHAAPPGAEQGGAPADGGGEEGTGTRGPSAGEADGGRLMREWGETVSGRLRRLAEDSARPENRPRLQHFDARGERVDRVLLPESTLEALDVVEGSQGLGWVSGDPFRHYAKIYLYAQNGEGGVACSAACTDGLVRVLRAHGDRDVHRRVLEQVRRSEPGRLPARNGHTVDRLKEKMGTRELATAEVTFRGARAWPVGPLERGLPTLLRHVLVPSRFGCVLFVAAALRRAERIAGAYAEFRKAFGRRIAEYPLVADSLARVRRGRRRALAACFRLLSLWEEARSTAGWAEATAAPEARVAAAGDFRVMLSLCKAELTRRATRLLHEAVTLLGGNGIEEAFSPLPRLYRDAVIMETWEGPYNVLLRQALKDLGRLDADPRDFVARVSGAGGSGQGAGELADRLGAVLHGGDTAPDTVAFGEVARELVSAFADRELAEAGERREG